jgi:hypothetical protein
VAELGFFEFAKDVFVEDGSPDIHALRETRLDFFDFRIVNEVRDSSVDENVLVRSQNESRFDIIRLGEVEIFR